MASCPSSWRNPFHPPISTHNLWRWQGGNNKESTSSYALVPISITVKNQEVSTWALFDTGAMVDLIDTRLYSTLEFTQVKWGLVSFADGSSLATTELKNLLQVDKIIWGNLFLFYCLEIVLPNCTWLPLVASGQVQPKLVKYVYFDQGKRTTFDLHPSWLNLKTKLLEKHSGPDRIRSPPLWEGKPTSVSERVPRRLKQSILLWTPKAPRLRS